MLLKYLVIGLKSFILLKKLFRTALLVDSDFPLLVSVIHCLGLLSLKNRNGVTLLGQLHIETRNRILVLFESSEQLLLDTLVPQSQFCRVASRF